MLHKCFYRPPPPSPPICSGPLYAYTLLLMLLLFYLFFVPSSPVRLTVHACGLGCASLVLRPRLSLFTCDFVFRFFFENGLFHPNVLACFLTLMPGCRWEDKGVVRNSVLNFFFASLYLFGNFSPDQIFRLYYGRAPPPKPSSLL